MNVSERRRELLKKELSGVLEKHEWEDGYDRDESHNRGEYVAHEFGLTHYFGNSAGVWADELAEAAIDFLHQKGLL